LADSAAKERTARMLATVILILLCALTGIVGVPLI
jgi:hypothetical protein